MPGERTADSGGDSAVGWSTDDLISLREHMQRQIDAERRRVDQLVSQQSLYFERLIAEARSQLVDRMGAIDAAAQKAAEAQVRALDKAETATEKRFESVNEFRGQLNDQANKLMTRTESLSRHDRTSEQLAELSSRHETDVRQLRERHEVDMSAINRRLDLTQGRGAGIEKAWGWVIGAIGLAGGIIGIIISTR